MEPLPLEHLGSVLMIMGSVGVVWMVLQWISRMVYKILSSLFFLTLLMLLCVYLLSLLLGPSTVEPIVHQVLQEVINVYYPLFRSYLSTLVKTVVSHIPFSALSSELWNLVK